MIARTFTIPYQVHPMLPLILSSTPLPLLGIAPGFLLSSNILTMLLYFLVRCVFHLPCKQFVTHKNVSTMSTEIVVLFCYSTGDMASCACYSSHAKICFSLISKSPSHLFFKLFFRSVILIATMRPL